MKNFFYTNPIIADTLILLGVAAAFGGVGVGFFFFMVGVR